MKQVLKKLTPTPATLVAIVGGECVYIGHAHPGWVFFGFALIGLAIGIAETL